MDYEIVMLKEKVAAGVSARTNNTDPNMGAVINGLWTQLFQEGLYETIPGKVNRKALGIYTDYAGDEKADYTAVAACEVSEKPDEEKFDVIEIPAGKYAKFIVRGDMVQAVAAGWQEIWKMNLPRSFRCDFEEYQDDNMEDTEIHIYVGLNGDGE